MARPRIYFRLPLWVAAAFKAEGMAAADVLLYAIIGSFKGGYRGRLDTLCGWMLIEDLRTLRRRLRGLEEKGLISRTDRAGATSVFCIRREGVECLEKVAGTQCSMERFISINPWQAKRLREHGIVFPAALIIFAAIHGFTHWYSGKGWGGTLAELATWAAGYSKKRVWECIMAMKRAGMVREVTGGSKYAVKCWVSAYGPLGEEEEYCVSPDEEEPQWGEVYLQEDVQEGQRAGGVEPTEETPAGCEAVQVEEKVKHEEAQEVQVEDCGGDNAEARECDRLQAPVCEPSWMKEEAPDVPVEGMELLAEIVEEIRSAPDMCGLREEVVDKAARHVFRMVSVDRAFREVDPGIKRKIIQGAARGLARRA